MGSTFVIPQGVTAPVVNIGDIFYTSGNIQIFMQQVIVPKANYFSPEIKTGIYNGLKTDFLTHFPCQLRTIMIDRKSNTLLLGAPNPS